MANRAALYKYKGDKCAHCGMSVLEAIQRFGTFNRLFEFNHIDTTKKHPDYDNLIQRVLSAAQLDEVDKCVLLCRNCHGILHAQNINGELLLTVKAKGKSASQRLKGQFIADRVAGRASFFTDERIGVWPCMVQIGSRKPTLWFAQDVEPAVLKLAKETRLRKSFQVRDGAGSLLLRGTNLDDETCKLEQSIRCPFLREELFTEDGKIAIYVREGKAITSSGEVIDNGVITLTLVYSGMP